MTNKGYEEQPAEGVADVVDYAVGTFAPMFPVARAFPLLTCQGFRAIGRLCAESHFPMSFKAVDEDAEKFAYLGHRFLDSSVKTTVVLYAQVPPRWVLGDISGAPMAAIYDLGGEIRG